MPLIKNKNDICDYIGEDRKDFTELIKKHELPAWRTKPTGRWKALRKDLDRWLVKRRDECVNLQN